jgi:zinc/manganese transport system permease protein
VSHFLSPLFEPGFFENAQVHVALVVGAVVALVASTVGWFAVLRGQSFAGEALADVGTTGGAGAFLVGVGPLWGFLALGAAAAAVMELIGIQRPRGRDLATGIVLGAGLGLAALFFSFDASYQNQTGATVTVLFGSIFAITSSMTPAIVALAVAALAIVLVLYRPLMLASVNPELAVARGLRVRAVGALYLVALVLAVALAALTIGTILSTALLVGPAAGAMRLTARPLRGLALAALAGVLAVWVGIVLAYDSYDWPPRGHGWPVSFFVVALVFLFYLLSGLPRARRAWVARNAARTHTPRAVVSEG